MNMRSMTKPCRRGVLGWMVAVTVSTAMAGWKADTVLPDLTACKLEGSLPPIAGKVVLLDFWASWCGPCKASFPALDELQGRYAARGLVVIAVNLDDKSEAMQAFLKEHPVAFTVVRDASHKLVQLADVQSMPSSFVIDRSGKVRFIHTGFHGQKTIEAYTTQIESLLQEKGVTK
ncbi:MAG: TlpA disulfide reductase family protein [bacterium]